MSSIKWLCNYFNLNQSKSTKFVTLSGDKKTIKKDEKMSKFGQFIMYIGVVLGVLFSELIHNDKNINKENFDFNILGILTIAVIALIIIPWIYEKMSINKDAPFIVRFGIFVQNGVFWQVILKGIGKTII